MACSESNRLGVNRAGRHKDTDFERFKHHPQPAGEPSLGVRQHPAWPGGRG